MRVDDFPANLRAERARAGLTLRELAARAKTSASYLCLLEQGKHTPSIDFAQRIAAALNVSMDALLVRPQIVRDRDAA